MGLIARMTTLVKAKLSQLLDRAEDPRQTLDYSYERQVEMLQDVKRGVVEVVTAKKRLELQAAKVRENSARLEDQARRAVAAGRDDLARMALQRKQLADTQLSDLDQQIGGLEAEQQKLMAAEQRLAAKVEAFRTRKEVVKAQYSAAEAQVRIGEAVTGLSEEMADVGVAVDRAEGKVERLRARASAIDELVTVGALEDLTAPGRGDVVERELGRLTAAQSVEEELAQLKRQVGPAEQPKELKEGGK